MLRGGCDGLGHVGSGGVVGVGRGEQVAAELLQEPDVGGCLSDTAPATAGSVEHRPHERQAGPFTGQAADDLDPATGLPEGPVRSSKIVQ